MAEAPLTDSQKLDTILADVGSAKNDIGAIKNRLKEGDTEFSNIRQEMRSEMENIRRGIEWNLGLAFNWMKEIALTRGRDDIAKEVEDHVAGGVSLNAPASRLSDPG